MSIIDGQGNHHRGAGAPGAGEFTAKRNSAPAGVLAPSELSEVTARVRLQRWTGRRQDQLVEVDSIELDVARALDTLSLDSVRQFGEAIDNDHLFDVLRDHGLVDHDGPYDVDLDDGHLADYIAGRATAGQDAPLRATVTRELAEIENDLTTVTGEHQRLNDRAHLLKTQFVASAVAAEVPDARYAVANPQSYPYLFDGDHKRIMIDDESAERLRVALDTQRIVGTFEL